jgi:hypothetical protein
LLAELSPNPDLNTCQNLLQLWFAQTLSSDAPDPCDLEVKGYPVPMPAPYSGLRGHGQELLSKNCLTNPFRLTLFDGISGERDQIDLSYLTWLKPFWRSQPKDGKEP